MFFIQTQYLLIAGLGGGLVHGDFASAFRLGIVSIAAFVAAALALVLADAFTRNS